MKITLNLPDDATILSPREVAEQLRIYGGLLLDDNERVGDIRLEYGDLEIDIHISEPEDPRIDGHLDRTETFDISKICTYLTAADYYAWGQDEDGDDVLVCFNY